MGDYTRRAVEFYHSEDDYEEEEEWEADYEGCEEEVMAIEPPTTSPDNSNSSIAATISHNSSKRAVAPTKFVDWISSRGRVHFAPNDDDYKPVDFREARFGPSSWYVVYSFSVVWSLLLSAFHFRAW
jgi:hypothetical protein